MNAPTLPVMAKALPDTEQPFAITHGEALATLRQLPDHSVDLVVTDPPYFIDGMDDHWDRNRLERRSSKAGRIGSLPVGMKFDPEQGRRFQAFMAPIAQEIHRLLKPGGFFIAFSQGRLYGRLAVAIEDAGFEIRDLLAWKYDGQAKAFSQSHFLRKAVASGKLSADEAATIEAKLDGRKTPQLRPQMEPMALAQKPREGTFIQNWLAHETGLMDARQSLDGKFPGNLMAVAKPKRHEKGETNPHLTVKPVALIEHLIRLFSTEGQLVLDPFCGSGSHGLAALRAGRRFYGIDQEARIL